MTCSWIPFRSIIAYHGVWNRLTVAYSPNEWWIIFVDVVSHTPGHLMEITLFPSRPEDCSKMSDRWNESACDIKGPAIVLWWNAEQSKDDIITPVHVIVGLILKRQLSTFCWAAHNHFICPSFWEPNTVGSLANLVRILKSLTCKNHSNVSPIFFHPS